MILLVSGATKTIRQEQGKMPLGHLLTPHNGNSIESVLKTRLPWAADNAAWKNFSPAAFCRMLGRIAGKPGCLFVCCPDVVGNARETAHLFYRWQPILKSMNLPVALVLQDGQHEVGIPWNMVDSLFIGGGDSFKMGPVAASIVREGKRRGLHVHMERCNTRKRLRYALGVGCDSFDGSGFSKWSRTRIPMAIKWLDELHNQFTLPLAA